MKISRIIIAVVVIVIVLVAGLVAYETLFAPTTTTGSSTWLPSAEYPIQVSGTFGVAGQQCLNSTGYVYCIGGQDADGGPRNGVYTSYPLASSANITGWTADANSYPVNINGQACAAYSGYAYCVGGSNDDSGDDIASSYYASVSSSGEVGNWSSTTSYPIPIDSQYCGASSGYIYCIGGNNETDGTNADSANSSSVWYATLSPSGIGAWSHSGAYPANLYYPSCFANDGYMYCLGGVNSNLDTQSTDYYAALSSTGVGTWTQTTAYPIQVAGQACAFSSGYIYCVGGQDSSGSYHHVFYYAPVSSGGIGSWKQAADYPMNVGTTCAASSGHLYCIGGFGSSAETSTVYYASLNTLSSATSG